MAANAMRWLCLTVIIRTTVEPQCIVNGLGHTDSAPNVAAKIGHSDIHLDSAAEVECAEAECVEALSAATGWSVTLLLEG